MFFKKEKKKKAERGRYVRIVGGQGILYEGRLEELPLREEVILAKSEEFFHDPDPCYIHRGAVSIRLYLELEEAAQKNEWGLWRRYIAFEDVQGIEL